MTFHLLRIRGREQIYQESAKHVWKWKGMSECVSRAWSGIISVPKCFAVFDGHSFWCPHEAFAKGAARGQAGLSHRLHLSFFLLIVYILPSPLIVRKTYRALLWDSPKFFTKLHSSAVALARCLFSLLTSGLANSLSVGLLGLSSLVSRSVIPAWKYFAFM